MELLVRMLIHYFYFNFFVVLKLLLEINGELKAKGNLTMTQGSHLYGYGTVQGSIITQVWQIT